jgi:dihydrofolate synthase/folylpolyglutamate synthase
MTYAEAAAWWYGRINYEVKAAAPADLKLERMRALLARLGDPHLRCRVVHVTGTKGKGSTCAMTAAALRAGGYRVGLFTSPHLERVEERVQVDGEPISGGELAAGMADIAAAVRDMDREPHPPASFFEIGTALGFLHFARRRVDVAVVEVGLGGRYDSTNVCRPSVCVVTSVGRDHTAQLGDTPEAIAYQKAGILKRRVPAVSGVTEPGPAAVVEAVAREVGAPLWRVGREVHVAYAAPHFADVLTPVARRAGLKLGLLGRHQAANAACAVAALDLLALPGTGPAVRAGLAGVRWPARVEVVGTAPAVVLDTAHNEPSVAALLDTLAEAVPVAGRRRVVFACSADKPVAEMLAKLAAGFDELHLCRYGNNPRGAAPEFLLHTLRRVAPTATGVTHPSAAAAWAAARSAAGPADLVCVTGSVFLAGELRPVVMQNAK